MHKYSPAERLLFKFVFIEPKQRRKRDNDDERFVISNTFLRDSVNNHQNRHHHRHHHHNDNVFSAAAAAEHTDRQAGNLANWENLNLSSFGLSFVRWPVVVAIVVGRSPWVTEAFPMLWNSPPLHIVVPINTNTRRGGVVKVTEYWIPYRNAARRSTRE